MISSTIPKVLKPKKKLKKIKKRIKKKYEKKEFAIYNNRSGGGGSVGAFQVIIMPGCYWFESNEQGDGYPQYSSMVEHPVSLSRYSLKVEPMASNHWIGVRVPLSAPLQPVQLNGRASALYTLDFRSIRNMGSKI